MTVVSAVTSCARLQDEGAPHSIAAVIAVGSIAAHGGALLSKRFDIVAQ